MFAHFCSFFPPIPLNISMSFHFTSQNSKNITLPENLKHRLEHELAMDLSKSKTAVTADSNKTKGARGNHQEFLSSSRQASVNASSVVDHALVERIRERNRSLESNLPFMELRMKNVQYTITNHFEDDPNKQQHNYESANQQQAPEGPRRATQHIETVASVGPMFRLWKKMKRFMTKGKCADFEQDTIIVDNINLVFEPGKMVLLLGGPGSGAYFYY